MTVVKLARREEVESVFRSLPLTVGKRISFFLSPLRAKNAAYLVKVLQVYPLPYLSVCIHLPNTQEEYDALSAVVTGNKDTDIIIDVFVCEPRPKFSLPLVKLLLTSTIVEALRLHDHNSSVEVVEFLSQSAAFSRNICHLFHFSFLPKAFSQPGSVGRVAKGLADIVKNDRSLCCLDVASFGVKLPTSMLKASGLLEALRTSTSLCYLRMADAGLDSEAAVLVANVLRKNKTLQYLSLSSNPIGDEGFAALAQSLEINSRLQVLNLAFTGATHKGAQALADSLCRNHSLRQLFLKDDCLGPKGGRAFADMLKINNTLRFLCLDFCELQAEGCRPFVSAMSVNRTLRVLRLNFNAIKWSDLVELVRRAVEGGVLKVLEVGDRNLLWEEASNFSEQQLEPRNLSYARHLARLSSTDIDV